jgi:hypothetical protein
MEITCKVGDLKRIISESSNEFKAVLGPNVEKENNSNNDKAYKDAKKRANDFDGGLNKEVGEEKAKYEKNDFNKTTLDYTPENADDNYRKRVHAQVKGYSSEQDMNNGIEKSGDFSDNENIYKAIKKSGEEYKDNEKKFKKSGLQAREWPDETFEKNTMYESIDGFNMRKMIDTIANKERNFSSVSENKSNNNVKTVYFKKTTFLTEEHMLSRIPDEFKKEGERFKMKDKTDNEYLIEWKNNRGRIVEHNNKSGLNESINRMKSLFEYKSSDSKTDRALRENESDTAFNNTLNNARNK